MEASGEFPPHCSSDEAMLRLGEGDGGGGSASEDRVKSVMEMRSHRSELMCVKIVESVRTMLRRLDRPRPSPRPLREEEVVEATAGAA